MFPQVDLHLYERSMFTHRFYVTDCTGAAADLTGYAARLELRREPDGTELFTSTSDDDLAVNAAGYIDLTWTGAQTETIGNTHGPVLKYDLFAWPGGSPDSAVLIAHGYVVAKKNLSTPQNTGGI